MSQTPSPPTPPQRPNWFRHQASDREVREQPRAGKSEVNPAQTNSDDTAIRSEVSRPKPVKKLAKRIANVPQFFLTLKADVSTSRPVVGVTAWLRHELETNRKGLLTSIGLHGLLLILFGLWVLPAGGQGRPTILNAGWTPLLSKSVQEAMSQPVKLESLQLSPVKTSTGFIPTKDKTDEQKPDEKSGAASQQAKPVGVGDALAGRTGAGRSAIFQDMKIDSKTERGISTGLAWLVRQQGKGGNWRLHEGGYPNPGDRTIRTDTGATALALLALLGDGHTTTEGQHSKAVAKGIAFLKSIQKANGDLHDHDELGRQTAFYAHSQATIALCEAYALSGDPFLKQPCQRTVKFLLESQHPQNGGWRYQPQTGNSMGDLSVTGWALMALHSARMAKFDVPFDNFQRAALFLDSVSEQQVARYKYQPADPSSKVSPAMTAEGVLCRQWIGWPKDHPQHVDAIEYLLSEEQRPEWKPGKRNVYAWYYTAQVLHNLGGQRWTEWYDHVSQQILDNQMTAGSNILGSWSPKIGRDLFGANEEYAEKAGRLYITAMCLLVLETPFRHAPIYQLEKSP